MMKPDALPSLVRERIVDVADFPSPGIVFKDITPLLADGPALQALVHHWAARYQDAGIAQVVAVESRGFLLGAPLAYALGVGVTLVRKPGKLPRPTHEIAYALEYGEDRLQLHQDALVPGMKVVIIDDVLATGGTASAAVELVRRTGAEIHELAFLIELVFLRGRARVGHDPVYSVVTFGG